ncbi:hypothetical protein V8C35DRAFT_315601 [Trichoderma chlorosporum]
MGVQNRLAEKQKGKHLRSQIEKVSAQIPHAQRTDTIKLELLFRNSDGDLAFADMFCRVLLNRAASDAAKSPLSRYFKHSPNDRVLPLGKCPAPGDDDFPTNTQGTRVYHFAAPHQHLLYNVAGSYYDEHLQWAVAEKLSSTTCTAAILPLPHVQDDRHFLCILDPEGQDVMRPKHGDLCKMHFPGAIETPVFEQKTLNSIGLDFFKILNKAQVEINFHQFVLDRAGNLFSRALTEEETEELRQTKDERQTGNTKLWSGRVKLWVVEHQDILRAQTLDDDEGNGDGARWFTACRVDFPSPNLKTQLQTYLVWKPTDKDAETVEGQLKPVLPIRLPNFEPPKGDDTALEYFTRLMNPENTQAVHIKRVFSDKTIRAEVDAVNSLKHPTSANPSPTDRSIVAYRYLMRFDDTVARTNLLDEIPALGNVINSANAPEFLREIFNKMNRPMRDAFGAMSSLPAGIFFLPGVAGSGKSFMMEMAIIFSQFGSCGASVQPADAEPQNIKILYLLNSNAGVEAFTRRLIETYNNHGIKNSPPVVRLYPMDSEIKAGVKGTTRQNYKETFSQSQAEKDREDVANENHFLATYAMNEISLGIHSAYDRTHKGARQNLDRSLHQAALDYLHSHRELPCYADLVELLDRVDRGEKLNDGSKSLFKSNFKILFQDFLEDFHGTIVTTPVAASNFAFREAFKPDLIILDEAGTMRELTALIPIAFFSPKAWILTGDIAQKPPYISMEHGLGAGKISSNPYSDQLTLSTLARASAAGAVKSCLLVNERAFGNSMAHANKLSYYGTMQPARMDTKINWPQNLMDMIAHVKQHINPTQPSAQCNVLVEFSGSQANKVATSLANAAHRKWTLKQALAIINSGLKGLGKNESKPADVLIIALYKAQALEYQNMRKEMVDKGEATKDVYRRIKIKTLDEAQGDEADFVFVDFVVVTHPGFTGEHFRITLGTTRARGINVYLLNRGVFVGYDKSSEVADRAIQLSRLFSLCQGTGSIHRLHYCIHCQGDHTADECTAKSEAMEGIQCERASCGKSGHNAATCPDRVCRNCGTRGHGANECPKPLLCSTCGNEDHVSFQCKTNNAAEFLCQNCQQRGHVASKCEKPSPNNNESNVKCFNCKAKGHSKEACPHPRDITCRNCGQQGHVRADCTQRQCKRCLEMGHSKNECTKPYCTRCRTAGHTRDGCRNGGRL